MIEAGLQMGYSNRGIRVQTSLTSASQAENTGSNPVGAILFEWAKPIQIKYLSFRLTGNPARKTSTETTNQPLHKEPRYGKPSGSIQSFLSVFLERL